MLTAFLALAVAPLAFAFWLWRRTQLAARPSTQRTLWLAAFGVAAACLAAWTESALLGVAGFERGPRPGAEWGALLFLLLFCAPLEEALKVAIVWPLYLRHRLQSGRHAALHVALVVSGYASAEVLLSFFFWGQRSGLDWIRSGLALPAHFFFSGLWGYLLGLERRDRYFALVWLVATLSRGVYEHLVFDRGAALLLVAVPVVILTSVATVFFLQPDRGEASRASRFSLFESAGVSSVRDVISRRGRPVLVRWILFGVPVTLGVVLVFLGLSVYLGHSWGVDFSLADEEGVEGLLPVLLLLAAVLLAFPLSGFLIARASRITSVLEPVWATAATILVVLLVFSITEPSAVVVVLAIAPVGVTLASLGAWLGLERR